MSAHGSGGKRSNADALLIAELAAGAPTDAAARAAGVSERTAYRRLADPAFRDRLEQARRDIISRTTRRVIAASAKAVATLEELLDHDNPSIRQRAGAKLLDLTWTRHDDELEARLDAIEDLLRQRPELFA